MAGETAWLSDVPNIPTVEGYAVVRVAYALASASACSEVVTTQRLPTSAVVLSAASGGPSAMGSWPLLCSPYCSAVSLGGGSPVERAGKDGAGKVSGQPAKGARGGTRQPIMCTWRLAIEHGT